MNKYGTIKDIIGKRILVVLGTKARKNAKAVPAQYILFEDKKTYIELEDQDYYSYHDCSTSAKEINIRIEEDRWSDLFNNAEYGVTTEVEF